MKRYVLTLAIALGLFAISPALGNVVSAQVPSDNGSNGSGQALEIAPPVLNLTADPGETVKTQISLRNISGGPLVVTSQINDFVAAGEDGTPKILMDEDGDKDNPYSLKRWVSPLSRLTLEPRQIENLPVTITVPDNASPGGYYGVVRFTATPPELEGTGVSLSASIGSLLLVRISGDAKESLAIEEFTVGKNGKPGSIFESTPLQFTERLKNTGNIHLQPAGQVSITDMFGKKVAAVNINLPPRNILPDSIRKFEQPLDEGVLGNKMLFGRYTAELKVTYGDSKQVVASSKTFWVIPYTLIAIIIALLVGGFFLFRFLLQRYNQRIISKAQNSQHNPPNNKDS